jgi:hypothetical protein
MTRQEIRESKNLKNFGCDINKDLLIELELILVKKQKTKVQWLTEKIEEEIKKEPT